MVKKMDKHGKEITIKINGKERPFMMEKPTDVEMVEREISAAIEEEAVIKEEAMLPVSFEEEKRLPKRSPLNRMINARIKSAFLSILLAVIIGTSFGFVVLHVIPKQKEHAVLTVSPAFNTVSSPKEETSKEASVQPLVVSVIQAGVFTDEKVAETYAKQLQSSQIPAVLVGKQPTSVFIGVGMDKQSLRPLDDLYKQKGQTTYIKAVSVSSINDLTMQSLYEMMTDLSVQLLAKNDVKDDQWTALESQYKKVQPAFNQKGGKYITNAYLSLIAYREKKEEALLWRTQQELLYALKKDVESTQ